MNLRLVAARVIDDVTQGRSLSDCLDPALKSLKEPRDRAFVQAICYGVCRFYTRLDVLLSHLVKKPMKAKDSDVHALLLVGLYQLIEMRVPAHAAVAETVSAADKLRKPWARALINAILREFLRHQTSFLETIAADSEAHFAHPDWWITRFKKAWPENWEAILLANNAHPPFALRVNQQRISRDAYLAKLNEQQLSASIIPETENGIVLKTPQSAEELPGFVAGEISVQDGAAQLAAELLMLEPKQRVLDACAAPGGKLTHLFACEPQLAALVAVENDAKRLSMMKENVARLIPNAQDQPITLICHDAGAPSHWWDGQLFDRILLDAPCSASGVIRRHPDIKLLREPEDIPALAAEQTELLTALWPLLKPNGLLLYATCSVFPEENVDVMEKFLSTHEDAQEEKITAAWGTACNIGRQIFPGWHDMDGFYYARLRKITNLSS